MQDKSAGDAGPVVVIDFDPLSATSSVCRYRRFPTPKSASAAVSPAADHRPRDDTNNQLTPQLAATTTAPRTHLSHTRHDPTTAGSKTPRHVSRGVGASLSPSSLFPAPLH